MRFLHPVILFSLALALIPISLTHAATTDLKDVPSGLYMLDPAHSSIVFRVAHMGTSYYTGRFNEFNATLEFDSQHPEKSALVVNIKPESIDTNNATLEKELKNDQNFNVARYPRISFVSLENKRTGVNTGKIEGSLTMFGVSRPVILYVTFNGWTESFLKKMPLLGFSATGSLKRSDFGFKSWLPSVGDVVTFQIEAEFVKSQGPGGKD